MATTYDAIVIGTGQAGPSLAVRLAGAGMKAAIIERKDTVVHRSNDGVEKWLKSTENLTVYEGHARFEGAHRLRVGSELLEADKIFVNVGGRASTPPLRGLDQVSYLNNSTMMEVDFLPEHLIVIGGSYVGLEFAQMYRRFGSEVTIVEMAPRLISREDEEVSQAVQSIIENEVIAVRLNAKCLAAERHGNDIAVHVRCEEEPRDIAGSHLLLAVGRVPNTDDLGLECAGVATDDRGVIKADHTLATNVVGK